MSIKNVEIWTDGSALKAPNKEFYCGCGAVLIYGENVKQISHEIGLATVNIAELSAPLIALKQLKEPCNVKIMSDSQYTISCITVWWNGFVRRGWRTQNKGEVKNKELIQELKRECDKHNVTWVKVKGHSGLYYNDMADELATRASAAVKEKMLDEC